jgi:hypothetical protein
MAMGWPWGVRSNTEYWVWRRLLLDSFNCSLCMYVCMYVWIYCMSIQPAGSFSGASATDIHFVYLPANVSGYTNKESLHATTSATVCWSPARGRGGNGESRWVRILRQTNVLSASSTTLEKTWSFRRNRLLLRGWMYEENCV